MKYPGPDSTRFLFNKVAKEIGNNLELLVYSHRNSILQTSVSPE